VDFIRKLDEKNHNLNTMRAVMIKGHGMYERSKGKASQASYKRAKEMMKEGKWGLVGSGSGAHPILFRRKDGGDASAKLSEEARRNALLRAVNSFRPSETVLEIGARGNADTAALMKQRRKALSKAAQRASAASTSAAAVSAQHEDEHEDAEHGSGVDMEMADEAEIEAVFDVSGKKNGGGSKANFRDSEFYMSHFQKDANTEKGYSLRDGATFAEQAQTVTFDLVGDEGALDRKRRELKWDKKKKKFVKGTGEGADNVKMVRTESGVKLPATYRSGRFDEWKAKSRVTLPKVGEAETESTHRRNAGPGGRKWKHNQVVAPKPLDKLSKDYDKKVRLQKKKEPQDGDSQPSKLPGTKGKAVRGRNAGKSVGKVKNELKTVDQIRKARKVLENKRAKNARPTRRKGKR